MNNQNNTKVAVITGAGRVRSVGAAVARAFAGKGYDLFITCNHSHHQALQVQQECQREGVETEIFVGDLTRTESCSELAAKVGDIHGKLDVLVNCLGFTKDVPYKKLDAMADEDFARILAINAMAPFQIVRAFHQLLTGTCGSVINISSNAGLSGNGSSIAYASAKGAENTLTLALAKALSPEVRVNAICPAFIDSSWWDEMYEKKDEEYQNLLERMARNNLVGRVITPEDVAHTAIFLAENPVINGELIRLDGGNHIGRLS